MRTRITTQSTKRRKLWQVNTAYHCSIIGTCLGRSDLRVLASKKEFQIPSQSDSYTTHNCLTQEACSRTKLCRNLTSYLDRKHSVAIRRYSHLMTECDITTQWKIDVEKGDASGAYWAIMTHPEATTAVLNTVYGECHMLSFDSFTKAKKDNQILTAYENNNRNLHNQVDRAKEKEDAFKSQRQVHLERIKALEAKVAELSATNNELQSRQLQEVPAVYEKLVLENRQLQNDLDYLQEQFDDTKDSVTKLDSQLRELETHSATLEDQNFEYKQELDSLENLLQQKFLAEPSCEKCEDHLTPACKGPDLCGQRVLYVGGQHKMITHYKQMVEKQGGVFLHHDGGKEDSRQQLPKVLCSADAVFCPIDCVSHDACKKVKKICKQYSKPFVMMRSSGLSSLAKSLGTFSKKEDYNVM